MDRSEVTTGGTYYTAGGLACLVLAVAGDKVVFKMTLHDGSQKTLESSVARFASTVTVDAPAP